MSTITIKGGVRIGNRTIPFEASNGTIEGALRAINLNPEDGYTVILNGTRIAGSDLGDTPVAAGDTVEVGRKHGAGTLALIAVR